MKKNFKLRRRVKRTIAALTMVMAIVVAAIPVENYGTMQVIGKLICLIFKCLTYFIYIRRIHFDIIIIFFFINIKLFYEAEKHINNVSNNLYVSAEYEDKYPNTDDDIKIAQHIEGDTFIDAYKINTNFNIFDLIWNIPTWSSIHINFYNRNIA